jgi:hypothetical protein
MSILFLANHPCLLVKAPLVNEVSLCVEQLQLSYVLHILIALMDNCLHFSFLNIFSNSVKIVCFLKIDLVIF